jgi:hypothetical protein
MLRTRIYRDHALMHHPHTPRGEFFIAKGDAAHVPPPGKNQIAVRAGGKGPAAFDQRNVERGEIVARKPRGGSTTETTTETTEA